MYEALVGISGKRRRMAVRDDSVFTDCPGWDSVLGVPFLTRRTEKKAIPDGSQRN
jgi:hypothetical protein